MGYRSDVVIVIYGENDDVTAFLASERLKGIPKGLDQHPLFETVGETYTKDMYNYDADAYTMMVFRWTHVKWYDDFPEISYWTDLASVWDDAFKNSMCMEIARTGENTDDFEVNYYGNHVEYALSIYTDISEDNMPKRSSEVLNLKENKNE